jgi:ABC-type multidrug transport system fused ATPase/permease subunit
MRTRPWDRSARLSMQEKPPACLGDRTCKAPRNARPTRSARTGPRAWTRTAEQFARIGYPCRTSKKSKPEETIIASLLRFTLGDRHRPTASPIDPLLPDDPAWLTFHLWLLIVSGSVFALFVAIKTGGLAFVVEHDLTFISDAVLLIYLATTAYCGQRALRLSRELAVAQALGGARPPGAAVDGQASWVMAFLKRDTRGGGAATREHLVQVLAERLRGPHEIGWFVTETLTKLGLLGTVIGFLVMLTALVGSSQLELSAMQSILRDMASGMGIKIIATVVGLLCNMVLALQWLLLDRCAEKVMSATLYLSIRDEQRSA